MTNQKSLDKKKIKELVDYIKSEIKNHKEDLGSCQDLMDGRTLAFHDILVWIKEHSVKNKITYSIKSSSPTMITKNIT